MKLDLPHIEIYYPYSKQYHEFLATTFSGEASLCKPLAIVCPKTHTDIVDFVKLANKVHIPFTVYGGGLSSLCIHNNMVCLALNKYYNQVKLVESDTGYLVHIQGGAKIGQILSILDTVGYHIPVGVSPLPGIGLVTRGGIGHLARSEGLTLDYIQKIRFIAANGEELNLSTTGDDIELWNAVRGSAPRFGVVSEVVLQAVPNNKVILATFSTDIKVLNNWLCRVDKLDNNLSASLVLGSNSQITYNPVLFGYVVNQNTEESAFRQINNFIYEVSTSYYYKWHNVPQLHNYANMPAFDVPQEQLSEQISQYFPFVKSYLIKNEHLKNLSHVLIKAIKDAPNQYCRIDLQHMGGKVATINNGSVFNGRDADWNLVVTGFAVNIDEGDAAVMWVNNILQQLEAAICSVYSVEIRNNRPETEKELNLAFGDSLNKLHSLITKYDPKGLLQHYPL